MLLERGMARIRRSTLGASAALVILACGGKDAPSGPPPVASVTVTAPGQVEVGSTIIAGAVAKDAKGNALTGKSFTWSSSAPTVASVDANGVVTGVSAGSATITAAADGKSGTAALTVIPIPVAAVLIAQRAPSVRQGESVQLSATVQDAIGRPLTDRAIAWSSSNPTIATVGNTGLAAGVAAGNAFIIAASEGKRDSVNLRVKSLFAPTATSTAPATWTPGASVTVTGTNFATTSSNNEVYVNGTAATVTAATATTITLTVPSALALPCTPEGPVPVTVVVSGDSATVSANLKMATPRTLAVGQSLMLTSQNDLLCNEFAATGGRYLVTAFNHAQSSSVRTSFQLLGLAHGAAATQLSVAQLPPPSPPGAGPLRALVLDRAAASRQAHLRMLEEDRQRIASAPDLLRDLRGRRDRARRGASEVSTTARAAFQPLANVTSQPPVNPPAVGDMVWKRMRRTFGSSTVFDTVRFRVVYVGPKLIIMEDTTNVMAGQMDGEYQALGSEFDRDMYGFLANFGDPVVLDSLLDNNGRVVALFSRRVNEYDVGGGGGLLGFVTSCDFFPQTSTTGSSCASSNEGEYFYSFVPNPGGVRGTYSLDTWKRYARGTAIHEMKHVVMFAERIARQAPSGEETWLEEATAQQATELWARRLYGSMQRGDIRWADGPRCDYAQVSASCPDPVEGIGHPFQFLYQYYSGNESRSYINNSDLVIYGGAWSFARWATDMFDGGNEGAFLRTLVQQVTDRGITNITARTGQNWQTLVGLFSMASLADNYPGATIADTRLRLPSWNTRDMFSGMNANLVFRNQDGSTTPAFPLQWPLRVRSQPFGTFPDAIRLVSSLPGGSFAAWDISGVQSSPQVLAIRAPGDGLPPSNIGMMVLRVQ